MKVEPKSDTTTPPKDRFQELGRKIMSVPKAEVDARDKAWHVERRTVNKRPKA